MFSLVWGAASWSELKSSNATRQYLFTLCQHIKKISIICPEQHNRVFFFHRNLFFFFFWHRTLKNNIWRRCTKLVNNIPVHFSQISGQFHALEVPSVGISTDKQPCKHTVVAICLWCEPLSLKTEAGPLCPHHTSYRWGVEASHHMTGFQLSLPFSMPLFEDKFFCTFEVPSKEDLGSVCFFMHEANKTKLG